MHSGIRAVLRRIVLLLLPVVICGTTGSAPAEDLSSNMNGEAEVLKFVTRWLELSQKNENFDEIMKLYADEVDFYKLGRVKKEAVAADKKKYFDRWPSREHRVISVSTAAGATGPEREFSLSFHYKIRNTKGAIKEGDASTLLVVRRAKGILVVVSEKDATTRIAHAEDLKCTYEQRFKDGGSKGVEARLTIEDGKIVGLNIFSFVLSGKEGGGYVCGIDTSDQEQKITWSNKDKKTILEVEGDLPKDKSVVEIEQIGGTYKINLERASLSACGFGAEWPQAVVIEKGNEKCHVNYEN